MILPPLVFPGLVFSYNKHSSLSLQSLHYKRYIIYSKDSRPSTVGRQPSAVGERTLLALNGSTEDLLRRQIKIDAEILD
jgi:hypothetical protein